MQGVLAPLAASVALLIGYLLVKFLPDLSIQSLLDGYFWLLGSVAVVGAFAAPAKTLVSTPAAWMPACMPGWKGMPTSSYVASSFWAGVWLTW